MGNSKCKNYKLINKKIDMGILGNPIKKGILKTPKTQNQQYHYSNIKEKTIPRISSQGFNHLNPYFTSGFKQIGQNDPVFKTNQIFYDTNTMNQEQGIFSGKQ